MFTRAAILGCRCWSARRWLSKMPQPPGSQPRSAGPAPAENLSHRRKPRPSTTRASRPAIRHRSSKGGSVAAHGVSHVSGVGLETAAVLLAQQRASRGRSSFADALRTYAEPGAAWDVMRADVGLRPYDIRRGERGRQRRPSTGLGGVDPHRAHGCEPRSGRAVQCVADECEPRMTRSMRSPVTNGDHGRRSGFTIPGRSHASPPLGCSSPTRASPRPSR